MCGSHGVRGVAVSASVTPGSPRHRKSMLPKGIRACRDPVLQHSTTRLVGRGAYDWVGATERTLTARDSNALRYGFAKVVPLRRTMATEFHAVSIKFKPDGCAAIKALDGQRFLSREAVLPPVSDCDNPNCGCTFFHHDDRRVVSRRDSDDGLRDAWYSGQDKRRGLGRRVTDCA